MRLHGSSIAAACVLVALSTSPALSQSDTAATPATDTGRTEIRNMVARLDLEKYKATIKGLTQFGDRRQGTDRNRAAVDWIEAQLKSYGCTDRAHQVRSTIRRRRGTRRPARRGRGGRHAAAARQGGGRAARHPHADRRQHRSDEAARREAARAQHASRRRRARARRSTARRSARRIPRRCTSSARTWTATAGARRPTTTARARRW